MSIQKRSYPPSKRYPRGRTTWRVRWLDRGQHRSREFSMQHEARAFELRTVQAVDSIETGTRIAASLTLEDLWKEWIAFRRPSILPTTEDAYESVWRTHLLPALGHQLLDELERRPKLVSDALGALAVRDRATGRPAVGRATRRKAHHLLAAMLRMGVAWNYLRSNPMDRLEMRAASSKREREIVPLSALRVEAIRAFLLARRFAPRNSHLGTLERNLHDVALVVLLAYAGLRPAEAMALRWCDLDLDLASGPASVLIRARNSDGVERDPKSQASLRSVPLAQALVADLRAWKLACADARPQALVFQGASGGLWSTDEWRAWTRASFKPAARAVGRPRAIAYDLRHSFILRLVLVGKTIPEVADEAGHEPEVTVRIYLGAYRLHAQMGVTRDEDLGEHYRRAREQVAAGIGLEG